MAGKKCECGGKMMRVLFGKHKFDYYICCNPLCKREVKTNDPHRPIRS